MPILFGGDIGIRDNAFTNFANKIAGEFSKAANGLVDAFTNLTSSTLPTPARSPIEQVYVDSGFNNVPGTAFLGSTVSNVSDIKTRQVITQEPQATVYIKKRAFWSLRAENDARFMDSGDRLFVRASKILFENKCNQIAAYEGVTKASRLLSEDAHLDAARLDAIADHLDSSFGALSESLETDALTALQTDPTNIQFNEEVIARLNSEHDRLAGVIEGIRKIAKNQRKLSRSTSTSWIVDTDNIDDIMGTGRGAGVIELTCVTDLRTELGIEDDLGSITFSMEDPYNLCKIHNDDIEMALRAAFNEERSDVVSLGPAKLLEDARSKDEELRRIRSARLSGGSFISGSNIADIVFEINASTRGKNKVVGYVSSVSEPFNANNFRIVFNQLPVEQRLGLSEDRLVAEIFDLLDQYVTEVGRLNNAKRVQNETKDMIYARRNLRNFYLGKSIIQPMDGVHVYIRSNTYRDSELIGPLSSLINNTSFIKSFRDDQEATYEMLEEEMRLFGIKDLDIPVDLYKTMRTGSFLRNAGMHVFGGLISNVTESYNPDRGYALSVSGQSNLKWLNLSRVNVRPSRDQTQGLLEDPLTPYDIKVDPATGLVVSEPPLLQENFEKIGNLKYKSGAYAGLAVDENNIVQDYTDTGTKILQHTPGLTYKWKQGIMTATRNVNLRTALDGSGSKSALLAREVGRTLVENPFSSMDAADVVSILVTGFPHNYESFLSHTRSTGNFVYGSGSNSPESYFHSSFDILRTTNKALGDFQPFKTINITPKQMSERLKLQAALQNDSKDLNRLRTELAQMQDKHNSLSVISAQITNETMRERIAAERKVAMDILARDIETLRGKIDTKLADFRKNITAANQKGLRVYGNDLALEIESAEGPDDENTSINKVRIKNELLQLRTQLRCKFNEDTNMFIVSDDYDKDLDIQAFILNMSNNIEMWNSEYKFPYEICSNVAKTLDMEFFADSQGHIQFRTPKYNKVPLSLLLKMFLLQDKESIKLYPTALESLFNAQQKSLTNEAEIVDLQIQVQIILLGSRELLNSRGELNLQQIDEGSFINVGKVLDVSGTSISEITGELSMLLIEKRNRLVSLMGGNPIEDNDFQREKALKEIEQYNDPSNPSMSINRLSAANKLSQLISRKQRLVDIIAKVSKQSDRINQIDVTQIRGTSLTPGNIIKDIMTKFADLIEDDYNDLLGPGSASRFVITDDRIMSSSFTESDTNVFCRVDVTGQENLIQQGPGVLGDIPIIWAGSTDFDLWRQYGYRSIGPLNKPFFRDAETQCAPYSQMLLTRAKKDAVRGQVVLAGNEYYQLGDVVYINSRELLYYVTRVSHDFSYASGSFTTTLDLRLGHPLGEYIPTPMDIIGKTLIKNHREFNNRMMYRQTSTLKSGSVVGTIKFDSTGGLSDTHNMLTGKYAKYNVAQLKNALLTIRKHIGSVSGYPKVEIRGFIENEAQSNTALTRMDAVITWLMSPVVYESGIAIPLSDLDFPPLYNENFEEFSDLDPINRSMIDFGSPNADRQPSDAANRLAGSDITSVVDIVLVFKPKLKAGE